MTKVDPSLEAGGGAESEKTNPVSDISAEIGGGRKKLSRGLGGPRLLPSAYPTDSTCQTRIHRPWYRW